MVTNTSSQDWKQFDDRQVFRLIVPFTLITPGRKIAAVKDCPQHFGRSEETHRTLSFMNFASSHLYPRGDKNCFDGLSGSSLMVCLIEEPGEDVDRKKRELSVFLQ